MGMCGMGVCGCMCGVCGGGDGGGVLGCVGVCVWECVGMCGWVSGVHMSGVPVSLQSVAPGVGVFVRSCVRASSADACDKNRQAWRCVLTHRPSSCDECKNKNKNKKLS